MPSQASPPQSRLGSKSAPVRIGAEVEARCRDLIRTLPALATADADAAAEEHPLESAPHERWSYSTKQVDGAKADPQGGALFLSHVWDEPKDWAKFFTAQPFTFAKQLQVGTGLRAAVRRRLGRPRVWVDWASLCNRIEGGEPRVKSDHPLAQVDFGPYQLPVKVLKDPAFLPGAEGSRTGYTVLRLPAGYKFAGEMHIRTFDEAGRPNKKAEPHPVSWEIAPGWFFVRNACVLPVDKISQEAAAEMDTFQSNTEHLRSWCARLGLRDEVWVELTLGSVRSECLALAEPMLALQSGFVAVVTWNYFDRLWPLCEWALFCAHRGPDRVQLAADAFVGPTQVEYHRAVRRLGVEAAACREMLDRRFLLSMLERVFALEVRMETLDYEKVGQLPLMKPVQQRTVDYKRVERYVRATAVAVFAREAAISASRAPHSDDEAGWAALAAELGLEELHTALHCCKPYDWAGRPAPGAGFSLSAAAEAAYEAQVEAWWSGQVLPVLGRELRRALTPRVGA